MNLARYTLLLILLTYSCASIASKRDKLEQEVIEIMEIELIVQKSIETYKSEIARMDNSVDMQFLEENFKDVFENAEARYLESYKKGLEAYSSEELAQLIEFYKSDFGKWYIQKSSKFNAIVQSDMPNSMKAINDAFSKRVATLQQ